MNLRRGVKLTCVPDKVGGHVLLAELHEVARVRGVVTADDDAEVGPVLDERLRGVLVFVGGVAERVARVGEALLDVGLAVALPHGVAHQVGDGGGLLRQHGRLVDHAQLLQVPLRVKVLRVLVLEVVVEEVGVLLAPDHLRQFFGLLHVPHDDHGAFFLGVGERGARLLVVPLAVDHDRVVVVPDLGALAPHLFDERAGGVVGLRVHPNLFEFLLHLQRGAEGGNDDHVVGRELVERDELLPLRGAQELDPPVPQVLVHVRVVDHLREEEDPFVGVLLQRLVRDLDRLLHAEAEAEVPRDFKAHRPEVDHRGGQVLLARVGGLPRVRDRRDDGAFVECGNVELAHGQSEVAGGQ